MGLPRRLQMAPLSRGIISSAGVRAHSTVLRPQQLLSTNLKCDAPSVARILSAKVRFPSSAVWNPTSIANYSILRQLHRISPNHSVLSRSSLVTKCLGTGDLSSRIEARQFHVSSLVSYDRLQNLEDAANRDRDNANTQAVFMQVQTSLEVLIL